MDESKRMPTATLNDKIAKRKWNLKSRKVMWIIQASIDRENYLYIYDIQEPKKVWDILAVVYSSSSNMRHLEQKLLEGRILVSGFSKNLEEEQNWFKDEDLNQGELVQLETGINLEDLEHDKVN